MAEFRTQEVTGTQNLSTNGIFSTMLASFSNYTCDSSSPKLTSLPNQIQMATDPASLIVIMGAPVWHSQLSV